MRGCVPLFLLLAVASLHPALAEGAPVTAGQPAGGEEHSGAPGKIEGRPSVTEVSPLQARVDAAAPGDTVTVEAGTYRGDLLIDRPIRLVGAGRPRLIGSGHGSVVHIRASNVTLDGFDIDGLSGGDLGDDTSGVHVAARRAVVRDCRISNTLIGIHLREADGASVERCSIHGIPGKEPGEKGSGIHVWNTQDFRLDENLIVDVRDGLYVQSSGGGRITRNVARDLRYGLHYMYSNDNVFEDNTFENGAAGTAIMYSQRIIFRRNRFLHNRGFASVGLLLKACDDVLAESNLIADNARGIFLEGSSRNVLRGNVVAESDMAIVLYDSCSKNLVTGNLFVGNMTPLLLVGRRTDTLFKGNYWSDNDEPDLDGDGTTDRPYRLTSVFDHFRGNVIAADLLSQSPAALALGVAERSFPVLQPLEVMDVAPLSRPPLLGEVPAARPAGRVADWGGVAGSASLAALGAFVLTRGGRRPRGQAGRAMPGDLR